MSRYILLFLLLSVITFFLNSLILLSAFADEITLNTELDYTISDSTTTNKKTGAKTESDLSIFVQQYNLNFSRNIYPNLILMGGGTFGLTNTTTIIENIEIGRDEKTIRPYIDLNLNSRLFTAGLNFHRSVAEEDSTGTTTLKNTSDDVNAAFEWRPVDLPHLNLFYTWSHASDNADSVDSVNKFLTVTARYTALDALPVYYTYTRNETENRITAFETLNQTHDGNINYSKSFFDRRISLFTGYRIRYNTIEFPGGSGSEPFPLLRSAGIFSLDDTPADGPALTDVTALIDGNLTVSSGVDIGWANAGGDDRNIGIDFGLPVSVNKIFIWVDRSLSSTGSSAFSWSVYTSPDNNDASIWTLQTTVSPATFGIFQNRFEISFPEIETRFIKVVTTPLSAAYSGDPNLQNIFVTEIEAFTAVSAEAGTTVTSTTEHNYNLGLRGKLSEKTTLGYNFTYSLREQDPSIERKTLMSNNIYVNHVFNRVFSAGARLLRNNTDSTDTDSITTENITYNYSASLKAAYIETFGQVLTYSGTQTTENGGSSDSNSVFLRNNLQLYTGWDAYVDAGHTRSKSILGIETKTSIIRTGTNIVPNEKIPINVNYTISKSSQSGDGTSATSKTLDVQSFYLPYKNLSLFARLTMTDDAASNRTYQNYSINWAPFPDGDLQFSLNYTETLRSIDEQEERIIMPRLSWKISSYAALEMSYIIARSDTKLETTDTTSFNTNFRMSF